MNTVDWLASLFSSIDAMDAAAFAGHLAPDAEFRFGNLPPVRGREAIAAFVGGFFQSIAGLRHAVERHWQAGDTVVCRGEVSYRRHDGSEVTVPFANIMHLANGLAADYRIYADVSPLYAPAA
jgi:ketosteroid isomerase-like protein